MKVTKETTMGEMLELDGGIALILMQAGMHCVGCPSSIGESLEEACMVHETVDQMLAILSGKNTEGQPSQEKESSTSDAEDTEAGEESAS